MLVSCSTSATHLICRAFGVRNFKRSSAEFICSLTKVVELHVFASVVSSSIHCILCSRAGGDDRPCDFRFSSPIVGRPSLRSGWAGTHLGVQVPSLWKVVVPFRRRNLRPLLSPDLSSMWARPYEAANANVRLRLRCPGSGVTLAHASIAFGWWSPKFHVVEFSAKLSLAAKALTLVSITLLCSGAAIARNSSLYRNFHF